MAYVRRTERESGLEGKITEDIHHRLSFQEIRFASLCYSLVLGTTLCHIMRRCTVHIANGSNRNSVPESPLELHISLLPLSCVAQVTELVDSKVQLQPSALISDQQLSTQLSILKLSLLAFNPSNKQSTQTTAICLRF